jgi:hypothetical protein
MNPYGDDDVSTTTGGFILFLNISVTFPPATLDEEAEKG